MLPEELHVQLHRPVPIGHLQDRVAIDVEHAHDHDQVSPSAGCGTGMDDLRWPLDVGFRPHQLLILGREARVAGWRPP